MKKGVLVFVVLMTFVSFVSADVFVSEVMADCGYRSACEFVELRADVPTNLTGWELDTGGQSMFLTSYFIMDSLIITKNKTAFLNEWPRVVKYKVIEWSGIGLVNGGDNVTLFENSDLVDSMEYFSSNKTSSWQYCSGNWVGGKPNPGKINLCWRNPDVDRSGWVNVRDYLGVRACLRRVGGFCGFADVNRDGVVDVYDLDFVRDYFGWEF